MAKALRVLIETKSNYKGLNGQYWLVKEANDTRVTCVIYDAELDTEMLVDFHISEVKAMKYGI